MNIKHIIIVLIVTSTATSVCMDAHKQRKQKLLEDIQDLGKDKKVTLDSEEPLFIASFNSLKSSSPDYFRIPIYLTHLQEIGIGNHIESLTNYPSQYLKPEKARNCMFIILWAYWVKRNCIPVAGEEFGEGRTWKEEEYTIFFPIYRYIVSPTLFHYYDPKNKRRRTRSANAHEYDTYFKGNNGL